MHRRALTDAHRRHRHRLSSRSEGRTSGGARRRRVMAATPALSGVPSAEIVVHDAALSSAPRRIDRQRADATDARRQVTPAPTAQPREAAHLPREHALGPSGTAHLPREASAGRVRAGSPGLEAGRRSVRGSSPARNTRRRPIRSRSPAHDGGSQGVGRQVNRLPGREVPRARRPVRVRPASSAPPRQPAQGGRPAASTRWDAEAEREPLEPSLR